MEPFLKHLCNEPETNRDVLLRVWLSDRDLPAIIRWLVQPEQQQQRVGSYCFQFWLNQQSGECSQKEIRLELCRQLESQLADQAANAHHVVTAIDVHYDATSKSDFCQQAREQILGAGYNPETLLNLNGRGIPANHDGLEAAESAELMNSEFNTQLLARLIRLEFLQQQFDATLQQEKLASLKQLAYGASHEVNNPLGNIATRSQTLMKTETDPERKRQLGMIAAQAFRAHDMIGDMMLYAHPPQPRLQAVSLQAAANRVISELQPIAEQQGTTVSLHCDSGNLEAFADEDHVLQSIKAICQNALEAITSGGNITIRISERPWNQQSFCEIHTMDDGPGLSDLARQHLFDPFFSGSEAGRGLGFGLSKAWAIAQIHGGKIEATDRPGGGTIITMLFPKHCAESTEAKHSVEI